jgi:NAD(P)-dependent dehydrogenase (short-subunit alcohol dehydrogenase family)
VAGIYWVKEGRVGRGAGAQPDRDVPLLGKRCGAIVNLASIMGLSGGIYPNASYQASKGAVVNLTRALALEWAADNIRVNAVAPTYVRTDFTVPIFSNPEMMKTVMGHTPLGRLPEVDDIAAAILFSVQRRGALHYGCDAPSGLGISCPLAMPFIGMVVRW